MDLADEGIQQNNCVGYYYNDSIERGDNCIFFLRKKDKPEKSYITCRYNIEKQELEYKIGKYLNSKIMFLKTDPEIFFSCIDYRLVPFS